MGKEEPHIGQLFLDKNTTFETQSARFMAMLMHAIKMLDDTEHFTESLDALSEKHVSYGVQIPMLDAFGKCLITEVKAMNMQYYDEQRGNASDASDDSKEETLDLFQVQQWTKKQDDSWKWFWSVVVGVMSAGMTKVRQNQEASRSQQSMARVEMNDQGQQDSQKNEPRTIPSKEELMKMDFSAA